MMPETWGTAGGVAALPGRCLGWVTAWGRSCRQDVLPALRVDLPLAVLLLLYAALWGPLVVRSTDNPQHLAAFLNDEPMIAQQLVGMTLPPYGNPGTLMTHPERRPAYWGSIVYGSLYYGGTYLDVALVLFAPLKLLGVADFPAAPVILRGLSLFFALVSLTVLSNLGREVGGRVAALGGALLLAVDMWFNYYSSIIHPDTTMLALGLLTLWVAIRHAGSGAWTGVVTMGLLVGLTHGAKVGGPWLIPVTLLALFWGTRAGALAGQTPWQRCSRFVRRGVVLGAAALAGFAVSTPFAFLDSHYRRTMRDTWRFNNEGPFAGVTYATWFEAIWNYEGPVLCGLALLALVLVPYRWLGKERPVALTLTAVLCVSVLAWYTTMVRLWAGPAYVLPALAVGGVLAAELFARPPHFLGRQGPWARRGGVVLGGVCLAAVLCYRGPERLNQALYEYCRECQTPVAVGRWAREHLPHESRILYDDVAYFEPDVFPNAMFHGGLLGYKDLQEKRPDYFVLSGSIYQFPHYVKLRQTQQYSRGREGPFSVLLYQDVLDRGGVPEAELVATFSGQGPPAAGPLQTALWFVRVALGREHVSIGPELRLYRYRPSTSFEPAASSREGQSNS